jgi:hypothetical protein
VLVARDCLTVFYEAFVAIVSDHKIDFWLVGLDEPHAWILAAWNFVHPVVVRYLGSPFCVGLSLVAMWDWCFKQL